MIHVSLGSTFLGVGIWVVLDVIREALRPAWGRWHNHPPERCKPNWNTPGEMMIGLATFVLVLWWASEPPT